MRSTEVLEQLARLADELGPGLEPPGAADQLLDIVSVLKDLLEAEACSISRVDLSDESLVFLAAAGQGAEQLIGTRMSLSKGIAGWVLASGQSLIVSDTTQDTRFAADVASATGYVPTSLLAVPLQNDEDVLGVLEVLDSRTEPTAITSRVVELLAQQATLTLETMAVFSDLGAALLNAVKNLTENNSDLQEALDEVARSGGGVGDLAELAGLFYELGRLGPDQRATATRMLSVFTSYAQRATPQL